MMGWMNAQIGPIGLDLGGRTVKAVQLERVRRAWRLRSAIAVTLPDANQPLDAAAVQYLKDALFRHGFAGRDLVLAAPTKQMTMEVLELPPRASGAPIEQIARMEMARCAKLESEPFEMDCWDLPGPTRGSNQTAVMAVALRHTDANALLDPFDAEGFNVIAIDARCCALARACRPKETEGTITAVLDLGWIGSLMGLVRDGLVIYQRWLADAQLGSLQNLVADEFQLDEQEASFVLRDVGLGGTPGAELATASHAARLRELIGRHTEPLVEEIEAAFHYAVHRYPDTPIARLLLAGGGSCIAGICPFLAERLDREVEVLSPARLVAASPELAKRCDDGVFATALGLALHGAK
jgi:Tfp pilus assembly PilM family ATPase